MGAYHIVMLGAQSPSADVLREVVENLDAQLSAVDSMNHVMLFDPDAILIELPSADGLAALHALAARRGADSAPIIAVLPHDADDLLTQAFDAGADDFIFAPVHPIAARATLQRCCRLSAYEKGSEADVRATLPFDADLSGWIGLVTSVPDVILRVDVSGRVEFANRPIVRGIEPAGKVISDVGIPNLGEDFFERFRQTILRQQSTVFETSGDHPTLGFRHYTLSLGPIVGHGAVTGVAVIVADVSEQRTAERALRENEQQLLTLVETAPDYIGILNKEGTIRFLNRGGGDVTVEEMIGQKMSAWLQTGFDEFEAAVAASLRDHVTHELTFEVNTKWFDARMRRTTFEGEPAVLVFASDVTRRKDLEAKLMHAGKMEAIGRLAGGVAHDFNNLLTSIVNFTWYVRDELPEGSSLREDLGEVLKAAESGARLTSQLLAFSRRKPTDPTVVELNDRIDQVRRVLERTIGENIRLEFRRSQEALPAIIDPGQLDQLIFNLAVNARDAMPAGGTLVFELREEGEMAVIEVVDDGLGIPMEIQDRLFEPFFSTKGENGTGLGLATCYGIARQAGGDILVESQPGQGAKFVVRLPLASLQDEAPEEQQVRISERTGARSVALVVEDQPAILKLVRRALEHAGWFVHTAASAEEALDVAREMKQAPGVLLTDVVLPERSGVDLARELRERWPDLPVLLVSGYLGDEFEPAMSAKGRTAFLPKPFNSVQLVSRLAVLLGD